MYDVSLPDAAVYRGTHRILLLEEIEMTEGIDRREKVDLLDWFEGLAENQGYVFAMRELYPKQVIKLESWGFTVTPVGKVERSNALKLCGVSALGAPKGSAAYHMLEVAAKRSKRLAYALAHPSRKPKTANRPYQEDEEGGG